MPTPTPLDAPNTDLEQVLRHDNLPPGQINRTNMVMSSGTALNGSVFNVVGEFSPTLFLRLAPGAAFYADRNLFEFMSDGIRMDPSVMNTGVGAFLKRQFVAGEPGIMLKFSAAQEDGVVVLSDHRIGQIVPICLKEGQSIIAERGSFMAGESSIKINVHIADDLVKRFVTGEQMIMQKIEGPGMVFLKV